MNPVSAILVGATLAILIGILAETYLGWRGRWRQ